MRYVIIRDDDTNAFTPVSCLERLYRPFLNRGLPVNLATIPEVSTKAHMVDGTPEGFLCYRNGTTAAARPVGSNRDLLSYLQQNPGYHIVQHGLHHDYHEFDSHDPADIAQRLDRGTELLTQAGFPRPRAFVAPYDKLSRESLRAVARRFAVLSTGWFELRRLPFTWWPGYVWKKMRSASHWRVGNTILLTHPGCLLSCHRDRDASRQQMIRLLNQNSLTVLVTHWWEYFRNGEPDEPFIGFLHETADYLSSNPELQVITFDRLAQDRLRLN